MTQNFRIKTRGHVLQDSSQDHLLMGTSQANPHKEAHSRNLLKAHPNKGAHSRNLLKDHPNRAVS